MEKLLWKPLKKEDQNFIKKLVKREFGAKRNENISPPATVLQSLLKMTCREIETFHSYDENLLEASMDDQKWDWGFRFDSGYRFSESGTYTNRHAGYIGLTWDLLKSGLLQARSKRRENSLKLGLIRLLNPEKQNKIMLPCREIGLVQFFSNLKAPLVKLKYDLLMIEYRALREAYFTGDILIDDLIRMEGEVKEAEEAMKFQNELKSFLPESGTVITGSKTAPLLRIRLKPLLNAVKKDSVYPNAVKLNEKILNEKSKTLNNNLLRLYFRSGIDSEDGETDYGTFVLGIRFSAPLGRSTKRENLVRMERCRFKGNMKLREKLLETVKMFNRYEDKMETAISLKHSEFVLKERLRRAWLLNEIKGGGGPTDIVRSLSELTDVRIKELSARESLYKILLYMFTRSGAGFSDKFVEIVKGRESVIRGRAGKRSIYLWSEAFNSYPNDFLIQVLRAKSISKIMLSYSGKSNKAKLKSFLLQAADSGVEVELMAGSNEWIFPEKRGRADGFTKSALSIANGVHLDVEPHTLKGYAKNEVEYKQLYLEMVKNIASLAAGKSLSVSIPLKWSGSLFDRLSGIVSQIYLMAYGVTDPEKLERRLAPFLNSGTEKLVIAVRPDDFANEWEMEKFLDNIFLRTGVREFAIHNFSSFLKMVSRENL